MLSETRPDILAIACDLSDIVIVVINIIFFGT